MGTLTWQFTRFDDLPLRDWYTISAARIEVFIMEQNCPFQDNDGADFHSWHLIGWDEQNGSNALAAYCRLVDPGIKFPEPSIGRVITPPAYRRQGYGRLLMAEAIRHHDILHPGRPNRIGAQARLEHFYRDFGFHKTSDIYIEDNIPHIEMLRLQPA
ncbi:MAG: GNAT family N-acetyltransferase [Betaproteobacteria bacterium]|nr:GNAT family N-acetyltransferase [Betaproteobacteria bacterium]